MRVFWLAKILEIVKMFAEGAFSDFVYSSENRYQH